MLRSVTTSRNTRLRLDVFNLFNRATNDITYYDESRLPANPPQAWLTCLFTQ